MAIGFLFPRSREGEHPGYTMRLHWTQSGFSASSAELGAATHHVLGGTICCYDPLAPATYAGQTVADSDVVIVRPTADDAREIRDLQNQIWRPTTPDALYPADIHSLDFRPGTSLVVKVVRKPAGFLFGFYKLRASALPALIAERFRTDFCLESQLMGILPEYRGHNLSVVLKREQAELARAEGIQIVNWTFDPLQYPNAHLNFSRLGAVAFAFYPNYYDFHNDLNVAPASRLLVTWLIDSARVRSELTGPGLTEIDLAATSDVVRLNRGPEPVAAPNGTRRIAIEIPENWTRLQRDAAQLELALSWRKTTDDILAQWLGVEHGKYVLTGTGRDAARHYLIGERIDDELLRVLSE